MLLDLSVYLIVFAIALTMAFIYQKTYHDIHFHRISSVNNSLNVLVYLISGCIFLFPLIAMYGLRYGIGTDYFSYERIYTVIHNASFSEYWIGHINNAGEFYVEPGYYILNKIFLSYHSLKWGIGVLLFSLVLLAVKDYFYKISIPFALFIYLTTQYIYAMNVTRFAIALCFILIGYKELSKNKTVNFVILVFLATLFHKSSFFCFPMYFLKQYKYKGVNSSRNLVLFISIILFPLISSYLLRIIGKIPLFERYFSVSHYSPSAAIGGGWSWILHILPVILPLLILCKKEIFDSEDTSILFRICIMEVPFRMLGLYNTWYTRCSRFSQIAEVIFIPLVLSKIKNKRKRMLLYLYYFIWFIFYFAYYAIINDNGDSLPYSWIFSQL